MNTNKQKMSWFEKISYGFGNMGLCLATTIVTSFLMYFYTDIAKLSLAQVGTIMLAGGMADAISDPLMGIFIDKTKTKWGKSRPYLLFCAIPMAVICALVFRVPDASQNVRYIYALVTYILYTLAYTAICIPQNVLMTSITDEPKERLHVNMFGTLGTTIGQFAVSAFAIATIAALGKGSQESGYFRTMLLFGAIGVVCILVCFRFTRERIAPPENVKVTTKDILKSMKNGPWVICAITSLCAIAIVVVRATSTVYFAQYVVGDMSIISKLLSITSLVTIPVTLLTLVLVPKFGKRNLVIVGAVAAILGNIGIFYSIHNTTMIMIYTVVVSAGLALPLAVVYVMTAETIDYGEYKNGVRIQGFLMAFVGFGVKVANSIATLVTSKILDNGGYVGGALEQSESAKNAIMTNYLLVPMILLAVIALANCFYGLDKKFPEIREELMKRRAAAANDEEAVAEA